MRRRLTSRFILILYKQKRKTARGDFNGINFNMNAQQSQTPNMYNQIDLTSSSTAPQSQFNTMYGNVPMNNQSSTNPQINNQINSLFN